MAQQLNKVVNEYLSKMTKYDLYNIIVRERQAAVSFKNMMIKFHQLSFLSLIELYKINPDNRLFSNGSVSDKLKSNIIAGSKTDNPDLPTDALSDFHGDGKPGVSPDMLKG